MSTSIARTGLHKAQFFLAQAALHQSEYARSGVLPFVANLEAAIVWGRSVTFLLKKEFSKLPDFDQWYSPRQMSMEQNDLHRFFLDARNLVLKEGPVPLARSITVHVESALAVVASSTVEVTVVRGAPWYRRHPRILWEDLKWHLLRPYRRWKTNRDEARRVAAARRQAQETTERGPSDTVIVHFVDPAFHNRAAVDLVRDYLNSMKQLVNEAEAKFM